MLEVCGITTGTVDANSCEVLVDVAEISTAAVEPGTCCVDEVVGVEGDTDSGGGNEVPGESTRVAVVDADIGEMLVGSGMFIDDATEVKDTEDIGLLCSGTIGDEDDGLIKVVDVVSCTGGMGGGDDVVV